MATHRAMQAQSMTVTASAPMSGPYATAAFLDAIFFGDVNLGSTEFFPLIISSAQNSYKSRPLYAATSDIIESAYASGFDTLLPGLSFSTLVQQGKLPLTQLFNSTPPVTGDPTLDGFFLANTPPTTPPAEAPLFALGFGANNLVKNSFRAAYVADALTNMDGEFTSPPTGLPSMNPVHPLRIDAALSDLRTWVPTTAPVLMCGGTNDPTVFYPVNTGAMQTLWSAELPALGTPQYLNVLDIDGVSPSVYPAPLTPLYTALQAGFAGAKAADPNAVQDYHGTLVPPFCMVAVQTFFSIQP